MSPKPTRRVPDDPGRPTPREAIAKATAAAGPKVAKAVEKATPKVEKAAVGAGKLLGTLRDRARETAKEFTDAYKGAEEETGPVPGDKPGPAPAPGKRRPRPRPTKD
jgi:hypothetical protein